jgi:hypothetical protein
VAKAEIDLSEFRRVKKAGCNFANLELKPEHVEVLKAAMQAPDISGQSIHDWLKARQYVIGVDTLRKHREGRCACPS